jgi:DNA-binding LacI/PurR family transcriptional regulator
VPIYLQIANQLRERILANEFNDLKKLPSNRELAELYKVNHLTVRQALKFLEQEGIINIAHGRGAFLVGHSLHRMQTALVLPSLGQEQSGVISSAIRGALGPEATIHVLDYHNRPTEELLCIDRILKEGYNSAIIYSSLHGEPLRRLLKMLVEGFPLVMVDRCIEGLPGSSVLSDNRRGGYLATQHMIAKGCRNIACFTAEIPSVRARYEGYRDALAEAGLQLRPELVVELSDLGDTNSTETTRLLEGKIRPDGIFYYNDYQALTGIQQIKAAGLRIPQDIRVVGFDDLTMGHLSDPRLTTVRQDHEQIGQEAARLLLDLVKMPVNQRFVTRRSVISVELIERESA